MPRSRSSSSGPAGVAQLVAHLSCKQVVEGSSPFASSEIKGNTSLPTLRKAEASTFASTLARRRGLRVRRFERRQHPRIMLPTAQIDVLRHRHPRVAELVRDDPRRDPRPVEDARRRLAPGVRGHPLQVAVEPHLVEPPADRARLPEATVDRAEDRLLRPDPDLSAPPQSVGVAY